MSKYNTFTDQLLCSSWGAVVINLLFWGGLLLLSFIVGEVSQDNISGQIQYKPSNGYVYKYEHQKLNPELEDQVLEYLEEEQEYADYLGDLEKSTRETSRFGAGY
jgi:hypothetical protein